MLWHNAIETWPVIKKDGANPLLATCAVMCELSLWGMSFARDQAILKSEREKTDASY